MASLVLLADRRAGRRSGWLRWAALIIGTGGSLAANVATAGSGAISRIIAGWPALALLMPVKLLSGLLDQHASVRPATISSGPASAQNATDPSSGAAVPIPVRLPGISRPPTSAVQPGSRGGTATYGTRSAPGAEPGDGRSLAAVADLLPAARAARDELHRAGHRLTRDALGARLRENGYRVRNSRLTRLLQALRSDTTTPTPTRADIAA